MGEINIIKCDICGEERRSDSKIKYHWSDIIGRVSITFKEHAGIQHAPFDGVMCTKCAKKLNIIIEDGLKTLRKG